MIKPQQVTD